MCSVRLRSALQGTPARTLHSSVSQTALVQRCHMQFAASIVRGAGLAGKRSQWSSTECIFPMRSMLSRLHATVDAPEGQLSIPTVDFDLERMRNNIRLTGNLGTDLEVKQLPGGRTVANGKLAVKNRDQTTWYYLEFWEELGELAAATLRQGSRIFIEGTPRIGVSKGSDGNSREFFKVSVRNVALINRQSPGEYAAQQQYSAKSDEGSVGGENSVQAGATSGPRQQSVSSGGNSKDHLWKDLLENPSTWTDFRQSIQKAKNPKFPDFKKQNGDALWIDSNGTPDWVYEALGISK